MNQILTNQKLYISIFAIYLLVLLLSAVANIPYVDSYYYWLWSKHLQLSYFDGPPMIAYTIRLATTVFGNSVFAINLVGIVVALLTTWVVANITNLILGHNRYGFLIGLMWFTDYAITTHRIINFVTYDGLENLFSLLAIMFTIRYIQLRKNYDLYFIGLNAGLALLSKYSAIIFIIAIISYFIYSKELRTVFKQIHVYLAMLITTIVSAPILIWNYQNKWISFWFQLTYHPYSEARTLATVLYFVYYYLFKTLLSSILPIIVLLLIVMCYNRGVNKVKLLDEVKNRQILGLLFTILTFIFGFWLVLSGVVRIPDRYMLVFESILIILLGIILLSHKFYKLFLFFIIYNLAFSVGDIISHCLVIRNPTCYEFYIKGHKLTFDSPLQKYIKVQPGASDFCYTEMRH